MPVRKKILTKAQRLTRERAIIKDLRAGKLSYRKIAAKHKVSLPTVNAKARKAGIRRSRSGPAGLRKATTRPRTTMKARRTTTKARRTKSTARKTRVTTRTTTRRPIARKKTIRRKITRKPVARKPATRKVSRRRISAVVRTERFQAELQDLVLMHYPNISLKAFSRLSKRIANVLQ
jgi:hypothetical protein